MKPARFDRLIQKHGFTLLELLLAVSLGVVVMAAITTSLFQGIKIYHRLIALGVEQDASFFLEQLTQDLRNAVPDAERPAQFDREQISFTAYRPASDSTMVRNSSPCRITYQWDSTKNEVRRVLQHLYADGEKTQTRVVSKGLQLIVYETTVEREGLPSRVTVTTQYGTKTGPLSFKKHIEVPIRVAYSA